MDEQAKWYVIHTYSGYENKVADNIMKVVENRKLQDLIQNVMIPTEIVTEIKDNKTKQVERKLYPCYVFVKMVMTDETWYVVRNTRGVTSFVGMGTKPTPLTEDEAASLGVEVKTVEIDYEVGDEVVIVSESLIDTKGKVKAIDIENNSVSVEITMLGRDTIVELELDEVEKLTD